MAFYHHPEEKKHAHDQSSNKVIPSTEKNNSDYQIQLVFTEHVLSPKHCDEILLLKNEHLLLFSLQHRTIK